MYFRVFIKTFMEAKAMTQELRALAAFSETHMVAQLPVNPVPEDLMFYEDLCGKQAWMAGYKCMQSNIHTPKIKINGLNLLSTPKWLP